MWDLSLQLMDCLVVSCRLQCVCGFSSCSMWALSSPTRDWTHIPCIAKAIPFFFFFNRDLKIYIFIFIFGCPESSLPRRLFSSCGKRGLLSSCSVRVSHCSGFSWRRARAPGHSGFSRAAPRLWSTGSLAVVHRLHCSKACGIFLTPWPMDQTHVLCTGRRILYHWVTREAPRWIFNHWATREVPLPIVFNHHR